MHIPVNSWITPTSDFTSDSPNGQENCTWTWLTELHTEMQWIPQNIHTSFVWLHACWASEPDLLYRGQRSAMFFKLISKSLQNSVLSSCWICCPLHHYSPYSLLFSPATVKLMTIPGIHANNSQGLLPPPSWIASLWLTWFVHQNLIYCFPNIWLFWTKPDVLKKHKAPQGNHI